MDNSGNTIIARLIAGTGRCAAARGGRHGVPSFVEKLGRWRVKLSLQTALGSVQVLLCFVLALFGHGVPSQTKSCSM